jgi:hypothetical protein
MLIFSQVGSQLLHFALDDDVEVKTHDEVIESESALFEE